MTRGTFTFLQETGAMQEHGPVQTTIGDGGLAPDVAGALAYVLGPITGVLFLIIGRSRFVRFHAMQSIGVAVGWIVLAIAISIFTGIRSALPLIGWMIGSLIGLLLWSIVGFAGFGLWLYLMFRAFQGDEWEVPLVGAQVRRLNAGQQPVR
jgi:uncharacterized membrane protein